MRTEKISTANSGGKGKKNASASTRLDWYVDVRTLRLLWSAPKVPHMQESCTC